MKVWRFAMLHRFVFFEEGHYRRWYWIPTARVSWIRVNVPHKKFFFGVRVGASYFFVFQKVSLVLQRRVILWCKILCFKEEGTFVLQRSLFVVQRNYLFFKEVPFMFQRKGFLFQKSSFRVAKKFFWCFKKVPFVLQRRRNAFRVSKDSLS